jgi:hypothetical protein
VLFRSCLDHLGSLTSLHDVEVRLLAFIDQHYLVAPHASLMGRAPSTVFRASPRPADALDEAKLRAALTVRERRRVRADTTVSIDGQDFELDQGYLAGRVVTVGRSLIAHYYNADLQRRGKLGVVYTCKNMTKNNAEFIPGSYVQDMERGLLPGINPLPWQTDTSIGDWFYNKNWKTKDTGKMYRTADWVVRTLADIVSKNGNLLLGVGPMADGTIPEGQRERLLGLGGWLEVNGVQVPFVSMNNEPGSTDPAVLEERYAAALGELWSLRSERP